MIKENNQDIKLKKTDLYKSIVENIENDSIFFQFINRDKNIYFYKVGIMKGKTFLTEDKSDDK